MVGHYISQIGLGEDAVLFATAATPDKILWLDEKNMRESGIDFNYVKNDSPSSSNNKRPDTTTAQKYPPPPMININPAGATLQGKPPPSSERTPSRNVNINSPTNNVQDIADGLRAKGYQADVDLTDPKNPTIITGIEGHRVLLNFSSCTGANCRYLEILSSWAEVNKSKAKIAQKKWNDDENYSSIFYKDDSNSIYLYHYFVLGDNGISVINLLENIEYFVKDFESVRDLLL